MALTLSCTFAASLVLGQSIRVGKDPSQMVFSQNRRCLAIACGTRTYVYDMRDGKTFRCPGGQLDDISPDGTKLALVSELKGRLQIWDVFRHRALRTWQKPTANNRYLSPAGVTFTPNGKSVIFNLETGDEQKIIPLVQLEIATGKMTNYTTWCRPLASKLAQTLTNMGIKDAVASNITYSAVFELPMRINGHGVISDALRVLSSRSLLYAVFTLNLENQQPSKVLTGFGLYYLWNGDNLHLGGGSKFDSITRWRDGREQKLMLTPSLPDGKNEEGDPGISTSHDTPYVLVYGIQHIATGERPTKRSLKSQRLVVQLLNAKTGEHRQVFESKFPWREAYCAISADGKLFACRSPYEANRIVIHRIGK